MKRNTAVLLCVLMLFSLTCCKSENTVESTAGTGTVPATPSETSAVSTTEAVKSTAEAQTSSSTTNNIFTSDSSDTVTTVSSSAAATDTGETLTQSTYSDPYSVSEYTTEPTSQNNENEESREAVPTVYFTRDISPDGLLRIYEALNRSPQGKVAVKLSTGESSMSYYLDPMLIKKLVQKVNGTIVECNTAYGGVRSSTALHKQIAKEHGFTEIAEVDIMDEDGSISLPVNGGTHLRENYVGSHFKNYDSFLVLSHFKGHPMAGYGGAIKNISIGIASPKGKCLIHTAGKSSTVMLGLNQNAFLESMADAGKSVSDSLNGGKNIAYINVMNNLSVDCDCVAIPAKPEMADIGILASTDPVAVDQACIDLVYAQRDGDGAALVRRIESRNGLHTLESAEKIGLGSRTYILKDIG